MRSDSIPKRILRLITPLAVHLSIATLVSTVGAIIISLWLQARYTGSSYTDLLNLYYDTVMKWSLPLTALGGLLAIPILGYMYRKDAKRIRLSKRDPGAGWYVLAAIGGMACCLFLNNVMEFTGITRLASEEYIEQTEAMMDNPLWLSLLCGAVVVPIAEELVFRGLIFKRMRTYLPVGTAILLSSLIFGLYHMNIIQFVYAGLLGAVLAYAYETFHSLVFPIILHGAANGLAFLLSADNGTGDFLYANMTVVVLSTLVAGVLFFALLLGMRNYQHKREIEEHAN